MMLCRTVAPARSPPGVSGRGRRVVAASILAGVHEGIYQRHPGERDGEFLRRFHFGLGLFLDALSLDIDLFPPESRGRRREFPGPARGGQFGA
jgi:hypothetical protein